jgi:hypothetical protein
MVLGLGVGIESTEWLEISPSTQPTNWFAPAAWLAPAHRARSSSADQAKFFHLLYTTNIIASFLPHQARSGSSLFQGIYLAGIYIYVLAMLATWGVAVKTQVSVIAFLGLPLYLKIFPGLLSDRVPVGRWGRRKPYILIGGLLYLPGFILLTAIHQFGTAWLADWAV